MTDKFIAAKDYSPDRLFKIINLTANMILRTDNLPRLKEILSVNIIGNNGRQLLCTFICKKSGQLVSEIDIKFSAQVRGMVICDVKSAISHQSLTDEQVENSLNCPEYSTICYGSALSFNAYLCVILVSKSANDLYNRGSIIKALSPYIHTVFSNIHFQSQNQQAFKLTLRERDIIHWMAKGKTNKEIATILAISQFTVKNHVANIYSKLDVVNRAQAIDKAIRLNYLKM